MQKATVTSHIIKGVIIAIVLMALSFFAHKTQLALPFALRLMPTILMVAGIVVSCVMFGRQTNGESVFGDIFAHGFKTTAVVTFLVAVYTFIISKYVFPLTEHEIEVVAKAMQSNMMEQEARRAAEEYARKSWIFDVGGAIFATVITGIVSSLIGAAIAKKKS